MRLLILLAIISMSCLAGAEPIRVACIGDSITQGAGAKSDKAYPIQLQALLGKDWDAKNFGVSGSTLSSKGDKPYITQGAWQKAKEFKPQVVVLMLGSNDTKMKNIGNAEGFKGDLMAMVKELQALDSKPTILLCLPCFVIAPGAFDIDEERLVAKVIPVVQAVAKEMKLQTIDIHAVTKAAATKDPGLIPDRVHPGAAGYGLIAETVQKELLKLKAK